jgi:5-methylcytosine-specific restriction protein A
LFRAPLEAPTDERPGINVDRHYVFPAVPVPSGVCYVDPSQMPTLPSSIRGAHNTFIREAATRRRVPSFKKSFSPGVVEYLEYVIGERLPRPSYFASSSDQGRRLETVGPDIEPEAYISFMPDLQRFSVE